MPRRSSLQKQGCSKTNQSPENLISRAFAVQAKPESTDQLAGGQSVEGQNLHRTPPEFSLFDAGIGRSRLIQPKLMIHAPKGKNEHEADSVARHVMHRLSSVPEGNLPVQLQPHQNGFISPSLPIQVIQRQILDPAYEQEVFDVEAEKRRTQVANMNLGSPKIAQNDSRKQSLEAFFSDPQNIKGTRSYSAPLSVSGKGSASHKTGNVNNTVLPNVLIVGDSTANATAKQKEHVDAELQLNTAYTQFVGNNQAYALAVDPLRTKAMAQMTAIAKNKIGKITHKHGQPIDDVDLAAKLQTLVTTFKQEASTAVDHVKWEEQVRERLDFKNSKADPNAAEIALDRTQNNIPKATDIYTKIYEKIGFDGAKIALISGASYEDDVLELHDKIVANQWPTFLNVVTTKLELLKFAIDKKQDLDGLNNPDQIVQIWFANPKSVTSVVQAQNILALALVGGNVAFGMRAAALLGTIPIPDLAALIEIDASGEFADLAEVKKLVGWGGNVFANKDMQGYGIPEKDIKDFNAKAGDTRDQIKTRWENLRDKVDDDQKKQQILKSFTLAGNATKLNLDTLVNNYVALSDRQTISSATVGALLTAGLLRAECRRYNSSRYGLGSVWVFHYIGGGRLDPEWHIHYQAAGRRTNVVGSGWKNKSEAFDFGVKTFSSSGSLQQVLESLGVWWEPRI